MPTYEYRCENCGRMEIFQPITASPLQECPQCSGPIKRIIGKNIVVLFKGSGFYCTDSRAASSEGSSEESSFTDSGESEAAASGK